MSCGKSSWFPIAAGLLVIAVLVAGAIWWVGGGSLPDSAGIGDRSDASASAEPSEIELVAPGDESGTSGVAGGAEDRLPAEPLDRAPGGEEEDAFQWVEGRVSMPPGTPEDERILVLAVDSARTARGLYGTPGLADMAWDPERQRIKALVATAETEPGGGFRIGLPRGSTEAHLAVTGRYLYSNATITVALPIVGEPPVLVGELGAWVTGKLLPPADPGPLESDFEWIQVELGPDLTGGFDAIGLADSAVPRTLEASADGSFEFRGVSGAGVHAILVRHDHLAVLRRPGIDPAPGEHVELALPMVRGATLSGRVVDEAGVGVKGADVEARYRGRMAEGIGAIRKTLSGEDGAFVLEHVAPGKIDVQASHEGYKRTRQKPADELADGRVIEGLELILEGGGLVRGRVEFPEGDVAEGATVQVYPDLREIGGLDGMKIATAESGTAEVGPAGTFEIRGLSEIAYQVVASLDAPEGDRSGSWRALARGVRPGGEDVRLVLARLEELTGLVVDLDDEPVTAFSVRATVVGSGGVLGLGAEERRWHFGEELDGRFRCEALRPATWELQVTAVGYATSAIQQVSVPRDPAAAPLRFVLAPAAGISGLVIGVGGEPVAGGRVALVLDLAGRMEAMKSGGVPSVFSDAEGRFLIEDLEPGLVSLSAALDGFAASEPVPCETIAGQVTEDVVLQLRIGGVLTGEVLDDDGEPDSNKMVVVQQTPSYRAQHVSQTDASGEFRFEHLEPGRWQVVATANLMSDDLGSPDGDEAEAMADLLGSLKMDVVEIVDGEEVHVVLGTPAADPVHLRGRVLHAGDPVPNAAIAMTPEGAASTSSLKIRMTDRNGAFEVDLDQPGAYLVTVQTGVSRGMQNSVEFLERIPEGSERYDLTLDLPLGRVSGFVAAPDGAPHAGCRVSLYVEGGIAYGSSLGGHYSELVTDAEGRYDISYLRPGTYTVAAGGAPLGGVFGERSEFGRVLRSGVTISEGQWLDSVDFRLEPSGELAGVVVDAAGNPAVGATVFVRDDHGRALERFSLVTTDAAGRFSYTGVAPGEYSISARVGGSSSGESARVYVPAGGRGEAQVALGAGTVLRVAVVDRSGLEVRAMVSVRDAAGREVSGMMSLDEAMEGFREGFSSKEQRIGPLPPGKYTVTATSDDGRGTTKPVTLKGQAERKLRLRLK